MPLALKPLCWRRADTALLRVPGRPRGTPALALMLPRGWMARTFAEPVADDDHPPSCQVRSACSTAQCPSPQGTPEGTLQGAESPHSGQLRAHA